MRRLLLVPLVLLFVLLFEAAAFAVTSVTDLSHGSFSLVCFYTHSAKDDPIVFPLQPGASHMHDFFGNRSANANSTEPTMRASTTGCKVHDDTAGYWSPAAGMPFSGTRLPGVRVKAYYLNLSSSNPVQTIPAGLQMIGGNKGAPSPSDNPHVSWNCAGGTPLVSHPYDCTPYPGGDVTGDVDFPSCYDGSGITKWDPNNLHVVYPPTGPAGPCPADHPVVLPTISLRIHYGIIDPCAGCGPNDPDTNVKLSLSSGPYWTLHADFWNTWVQPALDNLVQTCLNDHQPCGELASSVTLSSDPGLSATGGAGSVNLSWTVPCCTGGSSITGYNVYRSIAPGAETDIDSNPITCAPATCPSAGPPPKPLATVTGTSWQDISPTPGVTNYYRIAAVTSMGQGRLSNEASAAPQAPSPSPIPSASATPSPSPSSITSPSPSAIPSTSPSPTPTASATVPASPALSARTFRHGGVRLSWSVPADGGSPIMDYEVWRGPPSSSGTCAGGETYLTTVAASSTSYHDTATTPGTVYCYKVRAINAVGPGPFSNTASATAG